MRRVVVLAALAAGAFALLAGLVVSGALTSVDRYALEHLMPGLRPPYTSPGSILDSAIPLHDVRGETTIQVVVDVFTLPASPLLSALIVAALGAVLHRRGESRAAALWVGAWIVVDLVEVLAKHALSRSLLSARAGGRHVHAVGFEHSFPSGHAARALVVAAMCAFALPRLRPAAIAWAALTLPALEIAGFHTPTDIVGGALLAACAVVVTQHAAREPTVSASS
jgi:membrane-associated phospholipid phosphatase